MQIYKIVFQFLLKIIGVDVLHLNEASATGRACVAAYTVATWQTE